MKLLNTLKILLAASVVFTSCSDEFLDTAPTQSTGPDVAFENVANAKAAVNGLSRLMKRQYLGSQGFNGEGTIKMYYGNYMGNHFTAPLPGWSSVMNMEFVSNPVSTYTYYPWYYYYMIISNANAVITNIDNATGSDNEKAFLKAQGLTFRAYSYMMLVQLYGDRWADSNNGATPAVVLRVNEGIEDLPLSSLADAYKLIYDDLDQAVQLYTSSGLNRTSGRNYEANLDVAYAIYARAALNKEDYVNAEKYAKLARANYPLMSNTEYKSGFSNPNKEWIWSVFDSEQETIHFYSYQAYIAYNSTASAVRTAPKMISKELYDQIPATDIRKDLFLNPAAAGTAFNATTGQGNAAGLAYIRSLYADIPSNATAYSYMQFKIKANGMPGIGHTNNFRSAEMVLIEAEAKYKQNKPASEVQALLNELNKNTGRDASYNCTLTGIALFNEIKKYRAIELWGEGFDWFDMKRWGDTIKRKSFSEGGNFQTILAATIDPTQNNKWKIVTPAREVDFNTLID
ncbi:SusD-like starch-binding protein associating with outer membrane [Sphingobacterium alimentarium]|uniref:SusD-like starch-binding protein associating with outer membrane n=1 Tax=Sphingobacterium alimentarium TaxID=797292 RepID=A0A4R3VWP4_9SPHI|nr:RagB/SusD family nutrient uptake outer membrane protein [Sphingobacterium alimentarium]TCV10904.1 SusD-like starch-binding protein associating with outer membrane [Sphingobacterium alimentarium]